jgi:hypothetical protein
LVEFASKIFVKYIKSYWNFNSLNKFEKEQKVIQLHIEEKTIQVIVPIVHMSILDISEIIKAYEKNARFHGVNKEKQKSYLSGQKLTKKLYKSSQAYGLFLNGKTPVQVAMDLNLNFQRVRKYWLEYLSLKKMKKLYSIYIENEFHLDYLFKIYYFMLRNKIPNFTNVLPSTELNNRRITRTKK